MVNGNRMSQEDIEKDPYLMETLSKQDEHKREYYANQEGKTAHPDSTIDDHYRMSEDKRGPVNEGVPDAYPTPESEMGNDGVPDAYPTPKDEIEKYSETNRYVNATGEETLDEIKQKEPRRKSDAMKRGERKGPLTSNQTKDLTKAIDAAKNDIDIANNIPGDEKQDDKYAKSLEKTLDDHARGKTSKQQLLDKLDKAKLTNQPSKKQTKRQSPFDRPAPENIPNDRKVKTDVLRDKNAYDQHSRLKDWIKEVYKLDPEDEGFNEVVDQMYNDPEAFYEYGDAESTSLEARSYMSKQKDKGKEFESEFELPEHELSKVIRDHLFSPAGVEIREVLKKEGKTLEDYAGEIRTHFKTYPDDKSKLPHPMAKKIVEMMGGSGKTVQTMFQAIDNPMIDTDSRLNEGKKLHQAKEEELEKPKPETPEDRERRQDIIAAFADWGQRMVKSLLQYGNAMAVSKATIAGRQKLDTPKLDYKIESLTETLKQHRARKLALKKAKEDKKMDQAKLAQVQASTTKDIAQTKKYGTASIKDLAEAKNFEAKALSEANGKGSDKAYQQSDWVDDKGNPLSFNKDTGKRYKISKSGKLIEYHGKIKRKIIKIYRDPTGRNFKLNPDGTSEEITQQYGRPEQAVQMVDGQRKELSSVRKTLIGQMKVPTAKLAAARRIKETLMSNDKLTSTVIQTMMPRLAGEVGNLNVYEQQAWSGSPALLHRYEQFMKTHFDKKEGLTPKNRELILKLVESFTDSIIEDVDRSYDGAIKHLDSGYNIPSHITKLSLDDRPFFNKKEPKQKSKKQLSKAGTKFTIKNKEGTYIMTDDKGNYKKL